MAGVCSVLFYSILSPVASSRSKFFQIIVEVPFQYFIISIKGTIWQYFPQLFRGISCFLTVRLFNNIENHVEWYVLLTFPIIYLVACFHIFILHFTFFNHFCFTSLFYLLISFRFILFCFVIFQYVIALFSYLLLFFIFSLCHPRE